jgi:hypothetical protein
MLKVSQAFQPKFEHQGLKFFVLEAEAELCMSSLDALSLHKSHPFPKPVDDLITCPNQPGLGFQGYFLLFNLSLLEIIGHCL